MSTHSYDSIILGGGLYGLYAARFLADHGRTCLLLERDETLMRRTTWINQARVHNGYHYPRSLTTAHKSAHYYRRFHEDYAFCILSDFSQIYATSAQFSWTDRGQFVQFCEAAGIPCREMAPGTWFKPGLCDGAFLTEEDTYDAALLREYYLRELSARSDRVTLVTGADTGDIRVTGEGFRFTYRDQGGRGEEAVAVAPQAVNATYASTNQILKLINRGREADRQLPCFPIKYELCEIILCEPSEELKDIGITLMDGPCFSIMPFGKTGLHSLTAVTHTPHISCREDLPTFACQTPETGCSPGQLANCNDCPRKPASAWPYMSHLADKYLLPQFAYRLHSSLFSMKPILRTTEVDDARPTAIRVAELGERPGEARLISVLSGKINTVYDMDEVLL